MSGVTVQKEVWIIILETILIAIAVIRLSHRIDRIDPLQRPKGILLPVVLGVRKIYGDVKYYVGEGNARKLGPYILTISVYIFFSNIISLFGLSSPTANYSVTLTLAILTWILIQVTEFKYNGVGGWFHAFIEPFPVLLPMNLIEKFTLILSMSVRLFGNLTCGSIMMELIYTFCQTMSNKIAGLLGASGPVFNFLAPVLTPLLHAYFDCFAAFVQTLVFVTLTMALIGNDVPEEIKKV